MEMDVDAIPGGITRIQLEGRLDAAGADRIGLRYTAATVAAGRPAIVSLVGVSFISSMGIRLLISSARALSQKGATLVLFGAQPLVQDVLDQAAIDQIIPVLGSEAEAIERVVS